MLGRFTISNSQGMAVLKDPRSFGFPSNTYVTRSAPYRSHKYFRMPDKTTLLPVSTGKGRIVLMKTIFFRSLEPYSQPGPALLHPLPSQSCLTFASDTSNGAVTGREAQETQAQCLYTLPVPQWLMVYLLECLPILRVTEKGC